MNRDSDIPIIPLSDFTYSKVKKTLQTYRGVLGTPREFFVQSHKTGRVVRFVEDYEDMMQAEGYDGEARSYKPAPGEASCGIIRAFIVNWPSAV
jgi:hypothetical protein